MPADDTNKLHDKILKLELDVTSMRPELIMHEKLISKVSESIEKLQEVNINLVRMLALHTQKHEYYDQSEVQMKGEIRDLYEKLNVIKAEMYQRMDLVEKHIKSDIKDLRNDVIISKNASNEKFLDLNRFRYLIIGGTLTLGFILSKIDIARLLEIISK